MVTAYSRNPCLASMWYFYCSCINFLVGWRPLQGNIVTSQFSGGVKITQNRAGIGKGGGLLDFSYRMSFTIELYRISIQIPHPKLKFEK